MSVKNRKIKKVVREAWLLQRSSPQDVLKTGQGRNSESMRRNVMQAREYADFRNQGQDEAMCHTPHSIIDSCHLSSDDSIFLEELARIHHLSGRGIMRTLLLARTIADMEAVKHVTKDHICEALGFRIREGVGSA